MFFRENPGQNKLFQKFVQNPDFQFFMMFSQVWAIFGRQIRIPRRFLPIYMRFYEKFQEKTTYAKSCIFTL